ncbi:Dabb family protein [Arenibaculum pallidiluteum]|uniref:Dabb family protein n=1 Tax=Arenibaculum pallidiluteum TaxID=2812559 RepID=UPI001A9635AF|nr:Dabb family protein [Arenibaculum pallidiluteum]
MIFHSIRFQLREGVTQAQLDPVLKQLHKMGSEIPVIVTYCVGRDVGGDFDYGATFVVRNIDAYKTYMHSPIHRKVDEIGLPLVENMVSYDITDEADPTIAEQIALIHKERFAGDKALADLVGGLKSYSGSSKPE